jgi:hypothetical protein
MPKESKNKTAQPRNEQAALWEHPDPVGPDNDAHLTEAVIVSGGQVVVAWRAANPTPGSCRGRAAQASRRRPALPVRHEGWHPLDNR